MKVLVQTDWCVKFYSKDTATKETFKPILEFSALYKNSRVMHSIGLFMVFEYAPNAKSKIIIDAKSGDFIFIDGISNKSYIIAHNVSHNNGTFREAISNLEKVFTTVSTDEYLIIHSSGFLNARTYNYYEINSVNKEKYENTVNDSVEYFYDNYFRAKLATHYFGTFELKLKNKFLEERQVIIKLVNNSDNSKTLLEKLKYYIDYMEEEKEREIEI